MNVRMTDDLRGELQRLADAHKRTLSDYIRLTLEAHVEAQQHDRPHDAGKGKRDRS